MMSEREIRKVLERVQTTLGNYHRSGDYSGAELMSQRLYVLEAILNATGGNTALEAVKMAYRKHHLGDESVGWEELSTILHDALCNEMGEDGYLEWLEVNTH